MFLVLKEKEKIKYFSVKKLIKKLKMNKKVTNNRKVMNFI